MPPPRVLLTGPPGCGKTTVIRRAVEIIGPRRAAGFYTEEIREGGRRIGFDVVLLDGRRGPLARAGAAGPRVSRYGVDVRSFEALAVENLEAALVAEPGLLVIDEIGKMELLSPRFARLLHLIFEPSVHRPLLGTVMRGRHPLVDRIRAEGSVSVIPVTLENRDRLPQRLALLYERV